MSSAGGAHDRAASPLDAASSPLDRAQRLFFRAITWPQGVKDFLERADVDTRAEFERTFVGSDRLGAVERVDIYADAYFYRLLDVLKDLFPRLLFVAGNADFHNLVTDYLLAHPSGYPDLRRLGERLGVFLGAHELGRRWPVLVSLAKLEQALTDALDAPAPRLVTGRELQRVAPQDWESLEFSLSGPTRLVEGPRDLFELERLRSEGDADAARRLGCGEVDSTFVVSRRGHAAYYRRLEPLEADGLRLLAAGRSFGQTCAQLDGRYSSFDVAQVVAWLRQWLVDGLLAWR